MKKSSMKLFSFLSLLLVTIQVIAQQFEIRGVLPWHNFLSGPSAWNEDDYRKYLDQCQRRGINFIGFHNYTGGGERYFNYVEPMVKIQYKNVLPEARFDDGSTARWGYLPMKVKDFAYGTADLFQLPEGADYFGADCALIARTNEERYEMAQGLMRKVLKMAHERDMQMAMGFEFGVAPPEYASIRVKSDMYWLGNGSIVYNPFDPDATGILYATIDNILETYEGIDWIWLWLNEHCMFGVNADIALKNNLMAEYFQEYGKYYDSGKSDDNLKFLGVWAQAWIQKAYDYIRKKSPRTKIAIGGWGAESQMGLLLRGLDQALPQDIVFSMLNPGQGAKAHPDYFAAIAANREIWAIPWLEGDASLWHPQQRVANMRDHVTKAYNDNLQGVVAIHWRTEEIKPNFESFAHFASNPEDTLGIIGFYMDFCRREFGDFAAANLAPILAATDTTGAFNGIASPVYFAYTPRWGRLSENQKNVCDNIINVINGCISDEPDVSKVSALQWLKSTYEFALLLDEVSLNMEPAWELRNLCQTGIKPAVLTKQAVEKARIALDNAPIEKMMKVLSARIRARGEVGMLASVNQRVWGEYLLLDTFIKELSER